MTFTDVESAKEFYECYAHRVGFSIRIGQHKKVDGVVLYKCFLCANKYARSPQAVTSSTTAAPRLLTQPHN
ncbi:hypothetical protein DAI22_02g203400 [Oryza sativa Japonica Group]|nr:hypothetical protein DAI22_02g203400 [Oryza sativa Japonica Group]